MRTNKTTKFFIISLSALGGVLICLGFIGVYRDLNQVILPKVTQDEKDISPDEEIKIPEETTVSSDKSESLIADIGGAVLAPGVYELAADSRLADLVTAAGGFSDEADKTYINQTLNLAAILTDTAKIYIPQDGEAIEGVKIAAETSEAINGLSINNATEKELQTLTGIGAVRAQAIISGRPYKSVTELTERGILTEKLFTNIKEEITL